MKYYSVDPYSKCHSCGHKRPRVKSKVVCPTCHQEIKTSSSMGLEKCNRCGKDLERLLIGEKVDNNHVFLLQAYSELKTMSLTTWRRYLIGKKVVDAYGEPVNKGKLYYLIRSWPKAKDPVTGRRIPEKLMTWDASGNEVPYHDYGKDVKPWVMVKDGIIRESI